MGRYTIMVASGFEFYKKNIHISFSTKNNINNSKGYPKWKNGPKLNDLIDSYLF